LLIKDLVISGGVLDRLSPACSVGAAERQREKDSNPREVASRGFSRPSPLVAQIGGSGRDQPVYDGTVALVSLHRPKSAGNYGQVYGHGRSRDVLEACSEHLDDGGLRGARLLG
jgi:hypothetical protein